MMPTIPALVIIFILAAVYLGIEYQVTFRSDNS
jgi:hypothetical protein